MSSPPTQAELETLSDSSNSAPHSPRELVVEGWSQCSRCDCRIRVYDCEDRREATDYKHYCRWCTEELKPATRMDDLEAGWQSSWQSFLLQLSVRSSSPSSFEIVARRMSGEVATAVCCEKEISSSDFAQRLLTALTRSGALPPYCALRLILPNGALLRPGVTMGSLFTQLQEAPVAH
ncbi:MAG: hypothetical protein EBZ48_13895 [Proteobacteria bacterium]|nr:hypothetical protein [Pseudomonadota bacterium]